MHVARPRTFNLLNVCCILFIFILDSEMTLTFDESFVDKYHVKHKFFLSNLRISMFLFLRWRISIESSLCFWFSCTIWNTNSSASVAIYSMLYIFITETRTWLISQHTLILNVPLKHRPHYFPSPSFSRWSHRRAVWSMAHPDVARQCSHRFDFWVIILIFLDRLWFGVHVDMCFTMFT